MQLLCRNLDEGDRIIRQVLNIQGHAFELDNLTYNVNSNPARRYRTIPDRKPVLGSLQRMPRDRPVATLRFSFATLTIRGMQNPLILYSRTKQTRFALVE
ncbi:hypothetical protein [Microseira sp. BLCC-F43]|jgi:hypothetical protein|uniref:hypothetical protein n=1 Tax=Microseira sp. BLCC-F43 TaxID=3153602 RepID=UPI0035BA55E9